MAIDKLSQVTNNDFKVNDVIEPNQFDKNFDDLVKKVDEVIDTVNGWNGEIVEGGTSGASLVGIEDIEELSGATNVQEALEALVDTDNLLSSAIGTLNIDISNIEGNIADIQSALATLPTDYLKKDNETAFTPTGDYNPATKKYVDDAIDNSFPYTIEAMNVLTLGAGDTYYANDIIFPGAKKGNCLALAFNQSLNGCFASAFVVDNDLVGIQIYNPSAIEVALNIGSVIIMIIGKESFDLLNSYSLSYDGNGEDSGTIDQQFYVEGSSVLIEANTFVKSGFIFTEWNTQDDGNGTSYGEGDTYIMPSANTTLYAIWQALSLFIVGYNGNGNTGGTPPAPDLEYLEGSTCIVGYNSYTKVGGTFVDWNTASDGSGTSYEAEDGFIVTGNTTLYAQWDMDQYTVTYLPNNADSGDVPAPPTDYGYGEEVTVLGNTGGLIKAGKSFSGWNTNSNGLGLYYNPGEVFNISENVTLYAIFT
jgi:hypothetical protein